MKTESSALSTAVRLLVAPRFHLQPDWQARLQICSGAVVEGAAFFPRGDWRSVTPDELALLTLDNPEVMAEDSLALLALPQHLQDTWWQTAEALGTHQSETDSTLQRFFSAVADFLRFKALAVPEWCQFQVLLTRPGQRSLRHIPETGQELGLACTRPPDSGPALLALVNLGLQPAFLVWCPLPEKPPPLSQLVRVQLLPGEGCWLPRQGVILDGCPAQANVEVWLLVESAGNPVEAP